MNWFQSCNSLFCQVSLQKRNCFFFFQFLFKYYQVLMIYNLDLQFPHSCQDNLFQRNVHKARECWNFLWGSISGGTWAPFNTIFKVQSPKFQKSMFLVSSGTCVIGMKYLYVDRAKKFFSKMLRFQHQGYQMKALLKVDEEFQISDTCWHYYKVEIQFLSLDFTIFSSEIKNSCFLTLL